MRPLTTGYYDIKASAERENDVRKRGYVESASAEGNDDVNGDTDDTMDDEAETRLRMNCEGKRAENARTARFLRASALKREVNSSLAKF